MLASRILYCLLLAPSRVTVSPSATRTMCPSSVYPGRAAAVGPRGDEQYATPALAVAATSAITARVTPMRRNAARTAFTATLLSEIASTTTRMPRAMLPGVKGYPSAPIQFRHVPNVCSNT